MDLDIRHDPDARRFVAELDGQVSYVGYVALGDETLDFRQTYVPETLRGRGIAAALVEHALRHARDRGLKVVPSCPYVARFVERHPAFRDVVAR